MLNLDAHRQFLRKELPEKAFLHLSRDGGLFVSDAPRLNSKGEYRLTGYVCKQKGDLLYITPVFPDVPPKLAKMLIAYLKSDARAKSYLVRTNLAQAMREHDERSVRFLKSLLETEDTL